VAKGSGARRKSIAGGNEHPRPYEVIDIKSEKCSIRMAEIETERICVEEDL
jgi:hypothetical protein